MRRCDNVLKRCVYVRSPRKRNNNNSNNNRRGYACEWYSQKKISTINKVGRVDAISHTFSCWNGRTNEKKWLKLNMNFANDDTACCCCFELDSIRRISIKWHFFSIASFHFHFFFSLAVKPTNDFNETQMRWFFFPFSNLIYASDARWTSPETFILICRPHNRYLHN